MNNGRKSLFKWIVGLVLVVPIFILLIFIWVERDYIFGTVGIVHSGTKFGVSVGSPLSTATVTMENAKFELVGYATNSSKQPCPAPPEMSKLQISIFSDRSWRRGTVCITSQEGVIEYVAWRYSFLDP